MDDRDGSVYVTRYDGWISRNPNIFAHDAGAHWSHDQLAGYSLAGVFGTDDLTVFARGHDPKARAGQRYPTSDFFRWNGKAWSRMAGPGFHVVGCDPRRDRRRRQPAARRRRARRGGPSADARARSARRGPSPALRRRSRAPSAPRRAALHRHVARRPPGDARRPAHVEPAWWSSGDWHVWVSWGISILAVLVLGGRCRSD